MRWSSCAWVILCALPYASAIAAPDLTVSGISLGESLSSAEAKIGSAYKVTVLPSRQPNDPVSAVVAVNVSQTDAYEFGVIDGRL